MSNITIKAIRAINGETRKLNEISVYDVNISVLIGTNWSGAMGYIIGDITHSNVKYASPAFINPPKKSFKDNSNNRLKTRDIIFTTP